MDLLIRLLIVVVLGGLIAVVNLVYRQRRSADAALGAVDATTGAARWPDLPTELLDPAGAKAAPAHGTATWVIFSTPLCVSCAAVQADLERHFPHHRVHKIDAIERPDLADPYDVRRAPTTIVADATGRIIERLVGPEAVREFIGTADDPALRP